MRGAFAEDEGWIPRLFCQRTKDACWECGV